jgi:hypothetical protein
MSIAATALDWSGIATIAAITSLVLTLVVAAFALLTRVRGIKVVAPGFRFEGPSREPAEGINVRITTPDGGEVSMTFPPGADPEDVRRVVTDLLKQYQTVVGFDTPPPTGDTNHPQT